LNNPVEPRSGLYPCLEVPLATESDQNNLEKYEQAVFNYKRAQEELLEALHQLHKGGVYPSPPGQLRFHLPDERQGTTHKFEIGFREDGLEGYVTSGLYTDGRPGEIFITVSKEGTFASGVLDIFATTFSIALQSGVPLETLITKFKHARFEPSGMTKNPKIQNVGSVIDYVMRWLELKYTDKTGE